MFPPLKWICSVHIQSIVLKTYACHFAMFLATRTSSSTVVRMQLHRYCKFQDFCHMRSVLTVGWTNISHTSGVGWERSQRQSDSIWQTLLLKEKMRYSWLLLVTFKHSYDVITTNWFKVLHHSKLSTTKQVLGYFWLSRHKRDNFIRFFPPQQKWNCLFE